MEAIIKMISRDYSVQIILTSLRQISWDFKKTTAFETLNYKDENVFL